jgi:GT2 family glycosyltransferase
MIEREFPTVQLIKNSQNLGYAKGNNIGILHSKGEFVALLNSDTTVDPEWLSELVREAISNPNCFYQPKILFAGSKKINSAGNFIHLLGFAFPSGIGELDVGQYDKKRLISYASGACVFASRKLFTKCGMLDDLPFYEDVNLGWKASLLGYRSIYIPSSVIYHKWGGSWGAKLSSTKFFYIERGRLFTFFRNYFFRTIVLLLPAFIFVELLVLLYSLSHGFISEKIRVYADMLRLRKTIVNQRRKLQMRRKMTDSYVVRTFENGFTHIYFGIFALPLNKFFTFISKNLKPLIK